MRDAALAYAARNWAVFPLVERDKIPAIAGGFTMATVDADQIRQAWSHRPQMNIGIATGSPSRGLVVIDLDVHGASNGLDVLHEWERVNGELPETVTVETGSGGMHLFYQCNTPIACSVGTGDYEGVDVRGDGGYVVAPPSVHPSGGIYAWENDPEDVPLAKADERVYAFLRDVQDMNKPKKKFSMPDQIGAGKRNDTLMRYAASMQARGDDDVLILSALEAANKYKCKPPLPQSELEKIVESITGKYAKGTPRTHANVGVSLMLKASGVPQQTIENAGRVLDADPALAGRFRYNEVAYTRMVFLPVPWDQGEGDRPINDADYCGLAAYMEREYGLMSKQKAIDAVTNIAMRNRCNPITDWLDSLAWDGTGRVDTLLSCFLGCDPSDYNMAVMRLFMQGAVARVYEPGTKFDYMPVLIGKQGIGKSMFLRRLAHSSDWYCDNFNTVEGDAAAEKLRGMWIVEMAELLATKKQKDVESIKAFITSTVDTIRPKYARETEQRPRTCVFAGTTNDAQFLTDSTGNRRFLPIECGKYEAPMSLFAPDVSTYFEQAWAEAVHVYKTEHPTLVLEGRLAQYAIEKQEEYLEDDPRVGMIQQYLDERIATEKQKACPDLSRVRVCVQEIIDHALPSDLQRTQGAFIVNQLHRIMQNKIDGWMKYPKSKGKAMCGDYGVQRCYVPVDFGG